MSGALRRVSVARPNESIVVAGCHRHTPGTPLAFASFRSCKFDEGGSEAAFFHALRLLRLFFRHVLGHLSSQSVSQSVSSQSVSQGRRFTTTAWHAGSYRLLNLLVL
eukprot:COSAG02_NODE_27_length_51735_cov_86.076749_15_plen_107_part_00